MPKKRSKTMEEKQAEVLDGYEGWLKDRPVKKARAVAGDVGEDEKEEGK